MKQLILVIAVAFFPIACLAQNQKLITGFVVDAATGNIIEYVPIALKKQLSGTVSNEGGKFDFLIPESAINDTLAIMAFGYKPFYLPVKNIEGPLTIRLQASINQLAEVDVRPLPPAHYVLMALRRFKTNYPSQPYVSLAYYREKTTENGNFLQYGESVFKTYCPNYTDTTKSQHQLELYRTTNDIKELAFMKKERDKDEKRKADGKKEKNNVNIDMANSFSSPQDVLNNSRITAGNASFLDSTELKEYALDWAPSTFYNNEEVMVIAFKSKGKVDHIRESGKLYIERNSLAIVKIENSGDMIIPVILRPILFMYGLGIENPAFSKDIRFQRVGNYWYPQQIQVGIDFEITKRRIFAKNDESKFHIDQAYIVNQLRVSNCQPIPAALRFKGGDDIEKQVHNDEGLSWDNVNLIKK